jgi:HSP20 family protein
LAPQGESNGTRSPALDVTESERAYTVHLDMPGVAKGDVKIAIDGRRVNVEAQTQSNQEKKQGERVVYRERSVSSFSRSFTLPQDIDQAESQAKLDNGVLTLTLAKRRATTASQLAVN